MIGYLLGLLSGIPLGLFGAVIYFSRKKSGGVRLDAP